MLVMLYALLAPAEALLTYANGSLPLGKALAEISVQAGVPLTASDAYYNRPVFLVLNGVPVSTFRARLAEAAVGRWQPDGGTLRLVPDLPKQRAEASAERERRLRGLQVSLQRLREEAKLAEPFEDAMARRLASMVPAASPQRDSDGAYRMDTATLQRRDALLKQLPLGRMLADVVLRMDPSEWLDLPFSSRRVYSSRPTRMQRPLPNLSQALESLQAGQKRWLAAIERLGYLGEEWRPAAIGVNATDPPVTAFVIVQTISTIDLECRLQLFSESGALVGTTATQISFSPDQPEGMDATSAEGTAPNTPIAFSPLAQELASIVGVSMRGGSTPSISNGLRDYLLRPELKDFLGLTPFEAVAAFARHERRNVIAFPNDFMFGVGSYTVSSSGQPRPEDRATTLRDVERYNRALWRSSEREGFWLLRPTPWVAKVQPVDRRQLGTFLRRVQGKGRLDLSSRVKLVGLIPDDTEIQIPMMLARLLLGTNPQGEGPGSTQVLRLYGSLTPAQLGAAQTEEGLALGELQASQRAALAAMVYNRAYFRLELTPKPDRTPEEQNVFHNGVMSDPTYSLGNGIPTDGRLRVRLAEEAGIALMTFDRAQGFGQAALDSPEALAILTYAVETNNPRWASYRPEDPGVIRRLMESINLGKKTSLVVEIQFNDDLFFKESFSDFEVERRGVRLSDMPKPLLERYEKYLRELRDQHLPSRGGGGTAPPP